MYFKQIELTGFKSFADRTIVSLDPGVTAIVGPNGCGKSNILDALRWALGEQSAKALRGSHMQDVIFNGSEQRSATGMAEVSLTFDNADNKLPVDFAEVQISRRVYRSGESEYLLNKAPCRLRDIQELFMDTGIGTNAYSLIGQGKIDLVLSSKPEDRRYLFEEAAGIIKYKSRKKIALRKLDGAEQNLLRLQDIIAEVERQMRTLKRQVAAAIRHRELTTALRDLEIRNAWLKFKSLTEDIARLKEAFDTASKQYETASTETQRMEARLEALNVERIEVERMLLARRDGAHQISSEMEKVESQMKLIHKEIEFARHRQEEARKEHDDFKERAATVVTDQGRIQEQATGIRAEIQRLHQAISEKQEEHHQKGQAVAEADAAVEALRKQSIETLQSRNRTQTELETLAVNLNNIDKQLNTLYERQGGQTSRSEELATQLDESRGQETETQQRLTATVDQRQQAQAERQTRQEAMEKFGRELQEVREKKSSQEARLGSLRELRDSYEGFAAGVRAVMIAKQQNLPEVQGIIGPVGDLLSTEKEYERAIEAALGGNINNVVVEQADAAKAAVNFLKKNQAGRVTFLPLDTIRSSRDDDSGNLRGLPGVIGAAIQYVQYDARISTAVEYLMYNTVIVETIDDAIRIARSERRFPRLVTLDGEVVSSAGAVTGGRNRHESRGLLGRSAEIDELESSVKKAEKRVGELFQKAQAEQVRIQELIAQIRELEQQESETRKALNAVGVVLARLTTEFDRLQQDGQQISQERDRLLGERELLEKRRAETAERASSMDNDDETLQQKLADAQERAAGLRQAFSVCADEVSELRVQVAGISQSLEEAERNRLREERAHAEALQEAERRLHVIEEMKEREKTLEEQVAVNIERVKALSETQEEAQGKVVEAQNRQNKLNEDTEAVTRELKSLRERFTSAQKEVHSLELELSHKEDQVEYFQERILDEYQIALASLKAKEVGKDEHTDEERETLIAQHRKDLQRLGTVNLMAIEEYDTLEKRFEFLSTQEADLRQARETLLSVIERIDKTIREMFLETFNTVSENFKMFFRRLFNGGQARIYLLDEDDPLESGIEIEARPPGKKPQSISLLSGGEQAMTAIALLFSIFAAKPSPFCVLDEVDAPLDDANIGRFLSLVEEFTNDSQFIIITHNKQTMAAADALYGVTQQERGVSQLVSVRFDQAGEAVPAA
jgi:chromosome segregation protein